MQDHRASKTWSENEPDVRMMTLMITLSSNSVTMLRSRSITYEPLKGQRSMWRGQHINVHLF